MKKTACTILSAALTAAMLLTGCTEAGQTEPPRKHIPVTQCAPEGKIEGSSLYVEKVDGLSDDFILGMDASCVPALEACGVTFHDFDGTEQDVYQTLAENGINYIRVRIWNDPYDEQGNGYGGGNCDLENAIAIGKRATQYGMRVLVNFHYSDFWADPGKQMVPKAWKSMTLEEKSSALYDYTLKSLQALYAAGVDVGMVQIGNETNGTMCGETKWPNVAALMREGSNAVRQIFPDALVTIHFANPEKEGSYMSYANNLDYYGVDYDVFASSYYPYWHGTLENLSTVLNAVTEKYGKKVMVMETSYAYTPEDTDFNGNTVSNDGALVKNYPLTVQGQATEVRDVIDTVAKLPNGIGVVYWEGTWIAAGGKSWEENSQKWEQFGSGWASSYAADYDPNDAGKYYGGNAVDNQAMFDHNGMPLESLRVFNLVRYGNAVDPVVDAVEDAVLECDLGKPIRLPQTVNAILTDGSRTPVDVVWDVTTQQLEDMASGGAAKYTLTGTADGREVKAFLSVMEFNYLQNYSFETGDLTGWTLTDLKKSDELYVENKVTDSLTGSEHMHFWSAKADSVEFTLEQTVQLADAGDYKFNISIMGGDAGEHTVYAYVKVNAQTVATAPMEITVYGSWNTGTVPVFSVAAGDAVTVGIYVKCAGAGNGAWGKIDDGMLNSVK